MYTFMSSKDYPEALLNVREVLATHNTIYLEWTYQLNGSSPRTGVEIEIRRIGVLERTVIIGPEPNTTNISSLPPLATYNFTLFVVSNVGKSRPSSIIASTLSLSMHKIDM